MPPVDNLEEKNYSLESKGEQICDPLELHILERSEQKIRM